MRQPIRWLIFLMISSLLLAGQINMQTYTVHAETETITEKITFHYYSLVYKADNNSAFVYDGADTVGPRRTNAYQTTIDSQISGKITIFGMEWTYWSGMILWAYELTEETHVKGTVEITVYMSSSDTLSGLLSGGGYGMGLGEVDKDGNEIQRFIIEGPQSIGSNPLTSTPKAYTLSLEVDHVFAKDHAIVFFVGAGTTKQGYEFTVYFDSEDHNSGATLPVIVPLPTPSPTPTASPNESPSPSQSPSPNESPSPSSSDSPSTSPTPNPTTAPPPPHDMCIVALAISVITIITIASAVLLKRRFK